MRHSIELTKLAIDASLISCRKVAVGVWIAVWKRRARRRRVLRTSSAMADLPSLRTNIRETLY